MGSFLPQKQCCSFWSLRFSKDRVPGFQAPGGIRLLQREPWVGVISPVPSPPHSPVLRLFSLFRDRKSFN